MPSDSPDAIQARARQRAKEMGLPYAGALLPAEAHALLQGVPEAKLVDVRTEPEWEYVGRVPDSTLIEWNTFPAGQRNPQFLQQLESQVPKKDAPVMFLCRSGARSNQAAIAAARVGYSSAFNILEGFEGDKDENGHRNSVGGWRKAGLPWMQS